jgi:hypothetical protein
MYLFLWPHYKLSIEGLALSGHKIRFLITKLISQTRGRANLLVPVALKLFRSTLQFLYVGGMALSQAYGAAPVLSSIVVLRTRNVEVGQLGHPRADSEYNIIHSNDIEITIRLLSYVQRRHRIHS